jgi:hypothetical protein
MRRKRGFIANQTISETTTQSRFSLFAPTQKLKHFWLTQRVLRRLLTFTPVQWKLNSMIFHEILQKKQIHIEVGKKRNYYSVYTLHNHR